jgi:hypothetical protein
MIASISSKYGAQAAALKVKHEKLPMEVTRHYLSNEAN